MQLSTHPSPNEMYRALVDRDEAYEGIFFVGVRTTGIFCRPTCAGRKPLRQNVEFFRTTSEALFAGYRPCLRCHPMQLKDDAPDWLEPLLDALEEDHVRRWRDNDLRAAGFEPKRVQRWFKSKHGMTFHAYQRARRLGAALGQLSLGDDIAQTAFRHDYESLSGFNEAVGRLVGDSPGRARSRTVVRITRVPTPLGPMVIGVTDKAVCLLEFADRRMLETQLARIRKTLSAIIAPGETEIARATADEIARYFQGDLKTFTVPIDTTGSPFQEAVWGELRTIPYGTTRSYGEQARRIGRPSAVRAVARANGDNRIGIIVPCHRVVGADGTLTGYGGGLWRKQYLLDLERKHTNSHCSNTSTLRLDLRM